MLRTLLLPSTFLLALTTWAQVHDHRNCGAHDLTKRHLADKGLDTDLLRALPQERGIARGGTYTIPVVVHVVYNNTAENVPTSTINALIAEMNADYSATNTDISSVRSTFTNSIGSVNFQFCLAQVDPNGAATTGITRTQTTDTWFDPDAQTNDMKSAPLGRAPWDTERYLNIWICDITSGASGSTVTVGYAYLPVDGIVGSDIDGLVIDYDYGTQIGARTATHEIGHYFGLMHTFDDDGSCVDSDGFSDTPISNAPTYSCSNTNLRRCNNLLTQYENFMDYSDCTVMFTDQQAAYMADVLTEVRGGLLTNAACSGPVTGLCIPTSSNGTADGDFVNRVALGTINNANSGGIGQPAYTDFSGSFSTNLTRNSPYTLTIQGGSYAQGDNYAAWIDYDQDEVFESNERLGAFTTTAAGESQTISFTVPLTAALGNTVMRVRGVFFNENEPTTVEPCYNNAFGETEDYGITIVNNSSTALCIPTAASGTGDGDFVNAVILNTIENVNSGGTTAPAYTDFSSTHSTSLVHNGWYSILIQGGSFPQGDNYAAWIDYNNNDVFESGEKLGQFTTTEAEETGLITFTVPVGATLGNTTLRVRGVYFNTNEPTTVEPCYNNAFGETEDYGITIQAAPSDYCTPGSLIGTEDGDYIDDVVLESISNLNTGSATGPTYVNYNSTQGTGLMRDEEYVLTIGSGNYFPDTYAAWIDFDQDDVFETGEKLGEFVTAAIGESNDVTFTVPVNAQLGNTRLRIRGVYVNENEPTPLEPCFPYAYGETEDYRITIELNTDIASGTAGRLGLYPNPTTSVVTLELPAAQRAIIEVIDAQGRLVHTLTTAAQRSLIDVSGIAAGSYMVRVQQGDAFMTERLQILKH